MKVVRSRKVWVAAGAVVVLLVGSEITTRMVIGHRITNAARDILGSNADVEIGVRPAVIDAATRSIPSVTIRASGARKCQLDHLTVSAELDDLRPRGKSTHVSGSKATVLLTPQTIEAVVGDKMDSGTAVTVVPDAATGVLLLRLGPGGRIQIGERPSLTGDTITFSPTDITVNGQPAPSAISGQLATRRRSSSRFRTSR